MSPISQIRLHQGDHLPSGSDSLPWYGTPTAASGVPGIATVGTLADMPAATAGTQSGSDGAAAGMGFTSTSGLFTAANTGDTIAITDVGVTPAVVYSFTVTYSSQTALTLSGAGWSGTATADLPWVLSGSGPSNQGLWYFATDDTTAPATGSVYLSDGVEWLNVAGPGSGGGGSGIQFNSGTYGADNVGDYSTIETSLTNPDGYGLSLKNAYGMEVTSGALAAAADNASLETYQDLTSGGSGLLAQALYVGSVNFDGGTGSNVEAAEIAAATHGDGDVIGLLVGANASTDGTGNGNATAISASVTSAGNGGVVGASVTATRTASGTADGIDVTVTTENGGNLGLFINTTASGTGYSEGLLATTQTVSGDATAVEGDATSTGNGAATGVTGNSTSGGTAASVGVQGSSSSEGSGNAYGGQFNAEADGTGMEIAIIAQTAGVQSGANSIAIQALDSSNNPIFQVRNDGSVHIKTGTLVIPDL